MYHTHNIPVVNDNYRVTTYELILCNMSDMCYNSYAGAGVKQLLNVVNVKAHNGINNYGSNGALLYFCPGACI